MGNKKKENDQTQRAPEATQKQCTDINNGTGTIKSGQKNKKKRRYSRNFKAKKNS
jgi:hypothetical protein